MFKSWVRKFNGAIDPYWDTAEGQAETEGHATFDHHLGGGTHEQAREAARNEIELAKRAASKTEYNRAIHALERGDTEIEYLQDKYIEIYTENIKPGVRAFHDPRLRPDWEIKLENGRIYRADGKRRVGWWWV
jgi:hypothetical protein